MCNLKGQGHLHLTRANLTQASKHLGGENEWANSKET